MNNDLEEASSVNNELKSTISELETQLQQLQSQESIFTSTPFRSTSALSLHEELQNQEEGTSGMSNGVPPLRLNGEVSPLQPPRREKEVRSKSVHTRTSPGMESFKKFVEVTVSKASVHGVLVCNCDS